MLSLLIENRCYHSLQVATDECDDNRSLFISLSKLLQLRFDFKRLLLPIGNEKHTFSMKQNIVLCHIFKNDILPARLLRE